MADLDRITELVGNKEFEEAKPLIEEALKELPENIELLKLAGLTDVNLQLWFTARGHFETVVKFEPEDATSWFYLASCYDKLADLTSAKNAYIKVIELRNEYMEAYQSLCIILLKTNEPLEAVKYAQMASELDKENYIYDFIIGTAYMKNRDFKEAQAPLERALEKSPENLGNLNSLGTCYMALGKSEEAITTYKKALELNPKSVMAYFNIGSAYQIQQNHEMACEYLQKAIDLEEDEGFITALAMSEVKLGRYESALKHYKQLALMCPGKENFKYNIVTCYEALGEFQTAIKMLEEMVYVNPKFILPAQKLASLYIKTNQLDKAKKIYDDILLKNKVSAEILHQYAILSSSLCDTDTAEKMLKKVIRMNPELAKAHKDLGIIYLNKRLFDYARDEFETAMKLAPNDFEILFEYGNFLYSISENLEAERYYAEALEVEPKNVLALTFMALNKLILNQIDSAHDYIMKALKIQPHHEYVQFCAGRILFAKHEYEDAKRYLVRAVEQNPDIETQNTLALTYFELGEYQSALNVFKNIYAKSPKSVSLLMQIAKCYEALKDNDSALEYLDKVVEIFPENEDAHEMIRRLS
ncbi:MAG: tetratricopeptide repeat protein [Candidatus Gastranaerophilales bacterium]|nr:tetratricopeptide repeat protein [Candidatus Gastranaerophilales bacterium]MCM1073357.1 tetratricopeptide repeat protein [Bacteroides sp.]